MVVDTALAQNFVGVVIGDDEPVRYIYIYSGSLDRNNHTAVHSVYSMASMHQQLVEKQRLAWL